jgi:tRNA1(Val) A37 N6-methylase TrmN6
LGDESFVTKALGRDIERLSSRDRNVATESAFRYWRRRGFPYPRFALAELRRDLDLLERVDEKSLYRNGEIGFSRRGLKIVTHFQPRLWRIRDHGKSARDRFEDDGSLRIALRKAVRFWPDRCCWSPRALRSVFRILHRRRVSNFPPAAARVLLSRFAQRGGGLLDFSAGFGGRLLAAMSLGLDYVGIDPAQAQLRGLHSMLRTFADRSDSTVRLFHGCAEEILPRLPSSSVPIVFSSPPYFDTERYGQDATQSYRRYRTYDCWREHFLAVMIQESHRLLERGGVAILNLANANGHPIADDALRLASDGFRLKSTLRLRLMSLPNSRQARVRRTEPVFVFQKR